MVQCCFAPNCDQGHFNLGPKKHNFSTYGTFQNLVVKVRMNGNKKIINPNALL